VIFLNSQLWCPMDAILTTEELQARWTWIFCQLRQSHLFLWRFYLKNKTLKKSGSWLYWSACISVAMVSFQSPVLQNIKIKVPRKMSYRKRKFLIYQLYLLLPSLQLLIQSWAACLTPPVLLPFHPPSYHCFFKAWIPLPFLHKGKPH
jgi:hypothetical protein